MNRPLRTKEEWAALRQRAAALYATGELSQAAIAKRLGVSATFVGLAVAAAHGIPRRDRTRPAPSDFSAWRYTCAKCGGAFNSIAQERGVARRRAAVRLGGALVCSRCAAAMRQARRLRRPAVADMGGLAGETTVAPVGRLRLRD